MMDKWYEKVVDWLASPWFIGIFGLWMIVHSILLAITEGLSNDTYLSFISEMAIFIGLLILRAGNIQTERTDKAVKRDLQESKDIKDLLNKRIKVKR